jgi:hypothetical protein
MVAVYLGLLASPPDFRGAGQGEGKGSGPGEAGVDSGKSGGLVLGQPQEEASAGLKALGGQGDEYFQISNGPHGGKIECRRRGGSRPPFQAFAANVDVSEPAGAGGFLKKCPLLGHRFQQGGENARESYFERQAGEPGAAADVEQCAREFHVPGEEKALAKMPGDALFRVADGGQVDFLVPAQEQVEVGEDLVLLEGREAQAKGFEELAKPGFIEHAGIVKGPGPGRKARIGLDVSRGT